MSANKETALRFLKHLETGKVDRALITGDFQVWAAAVGNFPLEAFEPCMQGVIALMKDGLEFVVTAVTDGGDRVVFEAEARATLPSGEPYKQTYCFVAVFDGGKISAWKEYADTAYTQSALSMAYFTQRMLAAAQ